MKSGNELNSSEHNKHNKEHNKDQNIIRCVGAAESFNI